MTGRILAPLRRGATYRRGLFLLLGGVLALPYVLLVATFGHVWAAREAPWAVVLLVAALVAPAAVVPAFLTGTRVLEVAAARWLLGVELPDPRPGPAREARLRGALWFGLHLVIGGFVGAVLVVVVPVALVSVARGHRVLHPVLVVVLGVAALVAIGYAAAGLGALAAAMAPVLLGPSLAERVAALEARAVILAQRNRLARELHDSLGHALTVTTLQAAAARELLDVDAAFVGRALRAIEDAGRGAADELDRVLGVLREGQPPVPAPRLEEVERLVGQARAAGTRVSLTVRGPIGDVPAVVSREGYRIVQESLTNALRHAGPVPVTLSVSVRDGLVTIEAANPGRAGLGEGGAGGAGLSDGRHDEGRPGEHRAGGGRGLAGMRERVVLLGGVMEAGGDEGWWRLRVQLPVQRKP